MPDRPHRPEPRVAAGVQPTCARRTARRGQSAVEFALVLPLFILALTGVLDISRMLAIHGAAVTATREGARYGAAIGNGQGGVPRYVDCAGIRAAVRNASSTLVTLSDAQIRISHDNGAGTARSQPCAPHGTGPAAGDIQNLDRVLVQVTVTYEPVTPVIGALIGPITLVSVDRRTIVLEIP